MRAKIHDNLNLAIKSVIFSNLNSESTNTTCEEACFARICVAFKNFDFLDVNANASLTALHLYTGIIYRTQPLEYSSTVKTTPCMPPVYWITEVMMQPKYILKYFGKCNQIILHDVGNRSRKWCVVISYPCGHILHAVQSD